jgi:hypothetical protein
LYNKSLLDIIVAAFSPHDIETDQKTEYLSQIEIGGNMVTIPFGHFMDSFTHGMPGQLFYLGK